MDLIRDNIPDIRFLYDLKDVLYDQKWLKSAPNFEVYYMYRGLAKNAKDKQVMEKNNLRYDITVIPPKMLGKEFPKTLGHEHAKIEGTDITFAEIYEVLEGEAYYLLQKFKNGRITDICVVKTKKGEKCVVPPNYGHISINVSDKELIMANWLEKNFKSDYSLFKNHRGAGYYAIKPTPEAKTSISWLKNENYDNVPELKIYQVSDFNNLLEQFGIDPSIPMYNLVNEIEKLDFLKNPQKYEWQF